MERLYCPDFSSVFGPKYANPFLLPKIDSQIWPIFEEEEQPKEITDLLALSKNETPVLYRRKITLDQLRLEIEASSIQTVIFQALELNENYGIPNDYALRIAAKLDNSKVYCSIHPETDGLSKIKELYKKNKKLIAGFVIYPNYQSEFLNSPEFDEVITWIQTTELPIKIDMTDFHLTLLPSMPMFDLSELFNIIFLKLNTSIPIILSCINIRTLEYFIERYNYTSGVFLDLNMRILGGQSPAKFFINLFNIPGFIQNWWSRILLSSGSPTLETSQLVRGWYEATENLDMKFRHILRIWGFRNANRIFSFKPLESQRKTNFTYKITSEYKNSSQIHLGYDLHVQNFAITQLISIQTAFNDIMGEIKKSYPKIKSGQVTIKSYHTTVSLIINEHEIGNYLDLHYYFSEESKKDSQSNFHTVAAKENRADFNFPDHLMASRYGKRSITYHIRDGTVSKGSRENIYVLGTFGPRRMKIGIDVILFKN